MRGLPLDLRLGKPTVRRLPCIQRQRRQGVPGTSDHQCAAGVGPRVPAEEANRLGLSYLAGRPVGDLVDAEARAFAEDPSRYLLEVSDANLTALQTKQQLGIQALSIAGQQQSAVLQLLR